jgi:hypothetical protein
LLLIGQQGLVDSSGIGPCFPLAGGLCKFYANDGGKQQNPNLSRETVPLTGNKSSELIETIFLHLFSMEGLCSLAQCLGSEISFVKLCRAWKLLASFELPFVPFTSLREFRWRLHIAVINKGNFLKIIFPMNMIQNILNVVYNEKEERSSRWL